MKDDKLMGNRMFKNIGVDVDFVSKNANAANDRMNQMYWDRTQGPGTKPVPVPSIAPVSYPAAQVAPAASVDMDALYAQLVAYVDSRIADLASKMQSFADETDGKMASLSQVMTAQPQASQRTEERRQSTTTIVGAPNVNGRPIDGGAAAAKLAQQNALDPASVSIQKMFNFSNSRGGKIMR